MLISIKELVHAWNVKPNGVLHIGAHLAEERAEYERYSWQGSHKIIWIEAQEKLAKKLATSLNPGTNKVICAAVWGTSGVPMNLAITTNSQSTSLLEFGTHENNYPNVKVESIQKIFTTRVDELISNGDLFDFVNIDIQGAELEALKGMGALLTTVKWVYLEVNKQQVYKNCAQISEIDEYLEMFGFERKITEWIWGAGWGDAFYCKQPMEKQSILQTLNSRCRQSMRMTRKIFSYSSTLRLFKFLASKVKDI
jgi:FkbM family methyltransferase